MGDAERQSRWSLRRKTLVLFLGLGVSGILIVSAQGLWRNRVLINQAQYRSASVMASAAATALELPLAVRDRKEIERLAQGWIRETGVAFVAVMDAEDVPIQVAVVDHRLWDAYRSNPDAADVVAVQEPVISSLHDDFNLLAEPSADKGEQRIHGHVTIGLDRSAAVAAWWQQLISAGLTMGLTALIGSAIIVIAVRRWTRRLEGLVDASTRIADGRLDDTVPAQWDDELGRLAQHFDQMRLAIRSRDRELREWGNTLQQRVDEQTRDLREALVQAEEASRAKSRFLANMSHELRTPLNGVMGMSELLMTTRLNDRQRQFARASFDSAELLVTLINDILDFSKIEAGRMDLEELPFDIDELLSSVAELLAPKAAAKGLELILDLPANLPLQATGDPTRLRQVLLNVVSNAIKFTPSGHVMISARQDPGTDAESRLFTIAISDTGIGIPEDKLDSVFEHFTQADSSTTRQYGGTGLGLAICRRLLELMNGEMTISSRLGEGSTFTIRIELPVDTINQPGSWTQVRLTRIPVLVVDDNDLNREILEGQLSAWGMIPRCVSTAQSALAELDRAHAAGETYRLAIIDGDMPVTDGWELGRLIRDDERFSTMRLILLSSATPRLESDGDCFDSRLIKPAAGRRLQQAVACLLRDQQEGTRQLSKREQVMQAMLKAEHPPLAVLVVEDNRVNQLVAKDMLTQLGCIVTVASTGQEGLDQALTGRYGLIFMDCQMPVMDGYQATIRLRAVEESEDRPRLPVLAMTANALAEDRARCLEAGMDDYLPKPIKFEHLAELVGNWREKGMAYLRLVGAASDGT